MKVKGKCLENFACRKSLPQINQIGSAHLFMNEQRLNEYIIHESKW